MSNDMKATPKTCGGNHNVVERRRFYHTWGPGSQPSHSQVKLDSTDRVTSDHDLQSTVQPKNMKRENNQLRQLLQKLVTQFRTVQKHILVEEVKKEDVKKVVPDTLCSEEIGAKLLCSSIINADSLMTNVTTSEVSDNNIIHAEVQTVVTRPKIVYVMVDEKPLSFRILFGYMMTLVVFLYMLIEIVSENNDHSNYYHDTMCHHR